MGVEFKDQDLENKIDDSNCAVCLNVSEAESAWTVCVCVCVYTCIYIYIVFIYLLSFACSPWITKSTPALSDMKLWMTAQTMLWPFQIEFTNAPITISWLMVTFNHQPCLYNYVNSVCWLQAVGMRNTPEATTDELRAIGRRKLLISPPACDRHIAHVSTLTCQRLVGLDAMITLSSHCQCVCVCVCVCVAVGNLLLAFLLSLLQ